MPGKPVGLKGRVLILYLSMVFGWTGAPGVYMSFANAARALHEGYKPDEPKVNDTVGYSSEWLMDDPVI